AQKQEMYKERLPREEELFLAEVARRTMGHQKELSDAAKGAAQGNLGQRWEQFAADVARAILDCRKLKGYVDIREDLANSFRRARAEVLRASSPQGLFRGKVKYNKSDRTLELTYEFNSDEEKKDFERVKSNSLMEIDNKSAKIMGEFRLGKGDVFKNRLSVMGRALAGYNPDKPNINVAFWTHDDDKVTPKSRPRKPVEEDTEEGVKPTGVPLDYLVFAIGYRAPVLDRRLDEHEHLQPRGVGSIVPMPANAVLGGYRAKPLH